MAPLATIAPFGFSFDPARLLRAYRAIGCRSCQFYRNDDNPPSLAEALRASAAADLPFDSIHGRFGFNIDPSAPCAEHRRWCLNLYEEEGRLARDLTDAAASPTSTPMVVVHPAAWTPGRAQLTPAEAAASDAYRAPFLREFMAALAEIGERLGVTYLIENQPYNTYMGADPALLARRILDIGSARIRMCLDTGHANITGSAVQALLAAAPAIAYFHIHDNDGRLDDHRMPGDGGEGGIDWTAFAKALRDTDCRAVRMLEVFYDEARVESLAAAGLADRLQQALAL
jgi:sugar phosphate isomerase/epimerase